MHYFPKKKFRLIGQEIKKVRTKYDITKNKFISILVYYTSYSRLRNSGTSRRSESERVEHTRHLQAHNTSPQAQANIPRLRPRLRSSETSRRSESERVDNTRHLQAHNTSPQAQANISTRPTDQFIFPSSDIRYRDFPADSLRPRIGNFNFETRRTGQPRLIQARTTSPGQY